MKKQIRFKLSNKVVSREYIRFAINIIVNIIVLISLSLLFSLLNSGHVFAYASPLRSHTTPHIDLELQSEYSTAVFSLFLNPSASSSSFKVAGITWLPDWQWETRGFAKRTEDDKGGGDTDKIGRCGTYGMVEACGHPKVSTGTVKPVVGLVCQKACVCPTSYQYTTSNCLDSAGKMLTGITCNGKYASCVCKPTVSLGAGEQCTLSCNNNCVAKTCKAPVSAGIGEDCSENCASSGDCTAKICKPAVSVSASEICTQSCASNSAVCTAKSCKSAVGVGTGETCTQYCGSICTAKGCKAAVSLPNEYQCNERCASNTVVCTSRYCPFGTNTCGGYNDTVPKSGSGWSSSSCQRTDASSCTYGAVMYANSCSRQCYDSYTGSLPANASYTTSSCADCSGVYSLKTGWNCNSGYNKAGNNCIANCTPNNCFGYSLSYCPANGNCSSCTAGCGNNTPLYRLNSCKSGYVVSGNYCEMQCNYSDTCAQWRNRGCIMSSSYGICNGMGTGQGCHDMCGRTLWYCC